MQTPGKHDGRGRRSWLVPVMPPMHDLGRHDEQAEPDQHHGERQQRCAAQPRDRQERPVGLAEADHTPREATERHGGLEPFLYGPQRGEPQRPPGQPSADHGHESEQPAEDRFHRGQRQPRERADQSADPRQQRHVERQAEQEAITESACTRGGFAGERPRQQRERTEGGEPPADRRETQPQQQPATDGRAQLRDPVAHRPAEPGCPRDHRRSAGTGLRGLRGVLLGRRVVEVGFLVETALDVVVEFLVEVVDVVVLAVDDRRDHLGDIVRPGPQAVEPVAGPRLILSHGSSHPGARSGDTAATVRLRSAEAVREPGTAGRSTTAARHLPER